MQRFHIIIIVIAIVVLILFLVAIGMALQSEGKDVAFPLMQAQCPDGWITDVSGCSISTRNYGDVSLNNIVLSAGDQVVWASRTGQSFISKPTATICDKQKWARANGGIKWDGISNYNKCT
jgi:autotransporter translocation and assembly factor TamB